MKLFTISHHITVALLLFIFIISPVAYGQQNSSTPQPKDRWQKLKDQPEAQKPTAQQPGEMKNTLEAGQAVTPQLTTPLKHEEIPTPAKKVDVPEGRNVQPASPQMPNPLPQTVESRTPAHPAGRISLNFDDVDIYSVILTIFGEVLQVNYIVDPRVKGRVTFRSVAPIPHENVLPIMEVILRFNGVGIVEEAGLYRIVPISDVSREPISAGFGRKPEEIKLSGKILLHVIPVNNMQSTELVRLITPFISNNAILVDIPKTNQIMIVDTDASIKRILQLVTIFDSEYSKKRTPKVFVYNVQNSRAKDVANLLQQIFLGARPVGTGSVQRGTTATSAHAAGASVTPMPGAMQAMGSNAVVSDMTKIIPDEIINSIVILALPEDYEIIKQTIAKIDVVPRQVSIEGIIAQVTLEDNLSIGLAGYLKTNMFGLKSIIGLNVDRLPSQQSSASGQTSDTQQVSSSGFSFIGTDARGQVRALVTALASTSKAKLLAAPHILVSDNREASILVGSEVPIATSETFGSTTVAPQRTIQYKSTGIILKVKPHVNESGLISLELSQEISNYHLIKLFTNEENIVIDKAEAKTNLVVQDGNTIVIGGLIQEETNDTRGGVPILSKIPILGYLFGDTTNEKKRKEIIILLTPRVIKTQKEAKDVTSDHVNKFTEKNKGDISPDDLIKDRMQPILP